MNFPFFIARRYLFTKKSHHAINIISGISVGGVALATIALICTMSVFNGFHDMVASFFTSFDPELKVVPAQGKLMNHDDPNLLKLKNDKRIVVFTETLEDNALLMYGENQVIVTMKGVENNFKDLTQITELLYGDGNFQLSADVINYGILGIQLTQVLGVGARFIDPLQVYTPKRGERVNMANPSSSFNHDELLSPGVVFSTRQNKYDRNYMLVSLDFARRMFESEGQMTALEMRCAEGVDADKVKEDFEQLLGPNYKVLNRYEQQEDVFRIMKIEKLLSYIFLTFILVVACFNIIGSLSMLIIDKKEDVQTLRNLGATDKQICRIFLFEGRMISTFGAVIGVVIGLLICWGQATFGWLKLGAASGTFVVDAYPVSVHFTDVALILITVIAVGYLSVWYPVRYLSKKLL